MDTRTQLLLTAEKLFAEHGLDAVSLRQIAAEAGQRNVAATHYHFGDRQTLISAIFEYRLPLIDERREQMLDAVRSRGLDHDLWYLTELLVRPFAEQGARSGSYYVRFVARLYEQLGRRVDELSARGLAGSIVQATKLVQQRLIEDLPVEVARHRLELGGHLLITGAADLEARWQQGATDNELHLTRLVDAVAGLFGAPMSTGAQDQH